MLNSYFNHRVYCRADFRGLVDLLSGYLISRHYYVGDDDGCEYFKRSDIYIGDLEASVIAAPVKWLLKEGHGFLFKVVNLRQKSADKIINYKDLPIALRQRFPVCPNYIEIETYKSEYISQKQVGYELEQYLLNKGFQTYIRSFEGEFIDIIETGYTTFAETSEEIHKLVQEFLTKNSAYIFDSTNFPDELLPLIHDMQPDAIAALKTAEMIRNFLPDLPDTSPIVIEYCKAVEIELNNKLLQPLKLHGIGAISSASSLPMIPKELERLKKFTFSKSAKPLELGTLAITINAALKHDSHPLATNLLHNIKALPIPNSPRKLIDDILFLTQNFRNPAAHKAILSSEQMEKCRDFVIGTSVKPGLLFRILKASW